MTPCPYCGQTLPAEKEKEYLEEIAIGKIRKDASDAWSKYREESGLGKRGLYIVYAIPAIAFAYIIAGHWLPPVVNQIAIPTIFLAMLLATLYTIIIYKKERRQTKDNFAKKYPEYAQVIWKAEK